MKIFTEQPLLQYFGPLATKIQELIYKNKDLEGQLNGLQNLVAELAFGVFTHRQCETTTMASRKAFESVIKILILAEPLKTIKEINQNLKENLEMLHGVLEEAFDVEDTADEVSGLRRHNTLLYDALQNCNNEIDKIQLH